MAIKDTDDVRNRLRASSEPPKRPNIINDFQSPSRRTFPDIGRTLPQRRRFAPERPAPRPVDAPRQPRTTVPVDIAGSQLRQPTPPLAPAPQPAPQRQPKPKRRRRIITKKRVVLASLLVVLAAVVVAGWFGLKLITNVQKVFQGNIFSVLTTTKLNGEDQGRVNILLAGNSADDPGHDGANLTDSIMVVSLDTKHNTAFMLSVPRDLWVDIPGYGHAKINEAYVDGQAGHFKAPGYPDGGMGLLAETIQQTLGIKTQYYALINYNALRDAVNAVGGVDVTIQSEDPRGLYDPSIDWVTHGPLVKLNNGVQHLTGEQALDLARARGDAYGSYGFPRSDFDRTEHQRLMILALKSKVLSAGVLANPVTLGNLFDSIGKNVRTNFKLSEIRRLNDLGKLINNNQIQSVGLNDANGVNLLANYTSPTHQSTLIPAAGIDDFTQIDAFITRLMSNNLVTREGARVVVLNATDTSGLAAAKEKVLTAKGVNVTAIGDASTTVAVSSIIDVSGGKMPATLGLLKQVFGTHVTAKNPYATIYNADFIIVVGKDQVPAPAAQPQQ